MTILNIKWTIFRKDDKMWKELFGRAL